jgi:parvulin-like peptidyl-prolyl isomerase
MKREVAIVLGLLACGYVHAQQLSVNASNELKTVAIAAVDAKDAASVTPESPVITIKGLCQESGGTSASDCRSTIHRAEFESLVQFVEPNWSTAQKRQFATSYAEALVLAQQAHKLGLDSGPRFETLMKMQREFVLQYLLAQALKEKADKVPDADIQASYESNKASYDEIELERLYIPAMQSVSSAGLTAGELQKRQQDSMEMMKKVASDLHNRALKGAEFAQLQEEAYKAAGYTSTAGLPKGTTEKRRRPSMPQAELALLDLKAGDVSQVFDESNGLYIYRVLSRRVIPLSEVRDEISQRLRGERFRQYQREAHEVATPTLNEAYFRVGVEGSVSSSDEP